MKKKRLLSLVMSDALLFGSAAALPHGVFSESASITASAVTDGDYTYKELAYTLLTEDYKYGT